MVKEASKTLFLIKKALFSVSRYFKDLKTTFWIIDHVKPVMGF
jgi:hypothetical protein